MHHRTKYSILFPHIGQRMLKTAIAVFFCLLIYRLLGYQGETMPAEAAITAIICMQPFVSDSRAFALNRFAGTLIGAVWGLLFLLLLLVCPILGQNCVILYALMAAGVLLSVYTAVFLKVPDISGLSAIVFICIVIHFPDIEDPHIEVAGRFLGVMIGTVIAILVNLCHLPRRKTRDCVFFIRSKDLHPDRFTQASPAVLFHLNRLYEDGAKICLILEHAPAMFTMQMSSCQVSIPLIVMDGAAIYDPNENRYLETVTMPPNSSAEIRSWLRQHNVSFYTYIIRKNRTCIFHEGETNEQEALVYSQLRRSPYRSYLDGGDFHPEEIVYFKIISTNLKLAILHEDLAPFLAKYSCRCVIRRQASAPGVSALYIYSDQATPELAKERLMNLLRQKEPDLRSADIFSKTGYHSERDAAAILRKLKNAYEPVSFLPECRPQTDKTKRLCR